MKKFASAVIAAAMLLWAGGKALGQIPPDHIFWSQFGEAAYNHDGFSVAPASDVNGDGNPDVLVAAPTYLPSDQFGIAGRGKVYLYDGTNGNLIWSQAGFGASDEFGRGLSGGVDLNADGVPDILIGAPGESTSAGRVYMFSGLTLQLAYSASGEFLNDRFGNAVAVTSDLDADGKPDFFTGAPWHMNAANNGRVYARNGVSGQPIYSIDSPVSSIQLGFDVGDAGDVNQDGKNDVIAGGPKIDLGGHVYVFSSADQSILHSWNGQSLNAEFGYAVDGCGDVNGDSFPDLIMGAPYQPPNLKGKAYVYSGKDGTLIKDYLGATNPANAGQAVSYCGDVNMDGRPDIFFGADAEGPGGNGVAYIYSGANPSTLIRKFSAGNPYFSFSLGVGRAGDLNGDGRPEVIAGAEDSIFGTATAAGAVFALRVLPELEKEVTPGIAGTNNTFTVTAAAPGTPVYFYMSLMGDGRTPVAGCPGLAFDMHEAQFMAATVADVDGLAIVTPVIPQQYAGRTGFFQAVEPVHCAPTKRIRFDFPP